jgi:hypothetical protein
LRNPVGLLSRRILRRRGRSGRRYDASVRSLAIVLASAALVSGCATEPPGAPTIAAPAPFSFDPVQAGTPFVRRWLLLGPFEAAGPGAVTPAFIDESASAPRAGDHAAGHVWIERRVPARAVDFRDALPTGELSTAYAFTYLHAAAETDAVLWLGADNMSRMLLDGRVVHECRMRDANAQDAFCIAVHLTAGAHRLLVRVENTGGDHRLWLRISDATGGPIHTVVPALSPADDDLAAAAAANSTNFAPAELLALLPCDADPTISFDTRADLLRLAAGEGDDDCPRWRDAGGPDYGPSPGRRGALLLHAAAGDVPQRAYWKVRVPAAPSALRLVVSAEAFAAPGRADGLLRAYVFDGELRALTETIVASLPKASSEGWQVLKLALPSTSLGRDVLVVLEAASGGCEPWFYESVWFDEIAIVPAK